MKYLVLDISNLLYRTFYANKTEDDTTVAGLAAHQAFLTMQKYFNTFKPDKVIMCFDRSSWRKQYTLSDKCLSGKKYKGNRRKDMTAAQQAKYQIFLQHLDDFEELITEQTTIITLAAPLLEADDLMAGAVQVLTVDGENEVVLVTADKDMMQLLGYPNVRLIDPATGKDRTLENGVDKKGKPTGYNNDAGLFMFEKCIRGDMGDNVQSALPRCRLTRIRKAYEDDYERANLMNETWTDQNGKEFIVKELFNENMLLMSLSHQPEDIQRTIIETVLENLEKPGTFSYFHFMKFLGRFELKKLAQNADTFVDMLSR